ncbi:MAG: M20/M25/M40 family metallo-hydrolase [Deltaproteobacteria bacterium]|nr:M20/M25/M40 family metallo-hydrolase [Deltaproteobacteria bacterium]
MSKSLVGKNGAVGHLQDLLRIDTTNPPGNERAAIDWLAGILRQEGLTPTILEAAPGRANLVCRLPAATPNNAGPLLLSSHVDVVPAEADKWTHPPFGGVVADGYIWGRGVFDMKCKTVMDLVTFLAAKREGWPLCRDLILAAVADEEKGCTLGSKFLVERHPDLIRAEYCLNELGGCTIHVNGHRLYPIQMAQKGIAWLKLTMRGTPGHASRPHGDLAIAKLGHAVHRLTRRRLPQHVTPPARAFLAALAETLPAPKRWLLRGLLHPRLGPLLASRLPLTNATSLLLAITHNTACPTVVSGGRADAINVIPSEAACYVDGRIVPGQTAEDLVRELRAVLGTDCAIEILQSRNGAIQRTDTPLFAMIGEIIAEADPGARAVPFMLSGMTDAYFYHKLGIITYGFQPLRCPPGYNPTAQAHAHDERIPVEGFEWGVATYRALVRRFITQ